MFTADVLFKGTVGGTFAPGNTGYADHKASVLRLIDLPPETVVHPGHTLPTTIGEEREHNPFVRIWRGVDPEGDERVSVWDREATLVLWAPDYDGTNKAWVRFHDDGRTGSSAARRSSAEPPRDASLTGGSVGSMPPADLAIVGARIRTLDPERPSATAVAITDGEIVAVGSDAEVREACDASTEVVDGAGMAIVPGLVDSHQHPFRGTVETLGSTCRASTRVGELRDALAAERRRCGDGEWLRGHQLDYALFEESGIRAGLSTTSSRARRRS